MPMINVAASGGGDFLPIVKYDARAGRIFRVDRDDTGSNSVDITRSFKAVMDFESSEIGWIYFAAGGAPDFRMVPLGQDMNMPERPNDTYKQGVRFPVKLAATCGGDVREFATTSAATLRGINTLYDEYLRLAPTQPGKLPVVVLADTLAVESGGGTKRSTNYQPVFSITGWAPRPADMQAGAGARSNGAARPAPAPASRPPSPGSTRVDPPKTAAQQGESFETLADLGDDFG